MFSTPVRSQGSVDAVAEVEHGLLAFRIAHDHHCLVQPQHRRRQPLHLPRGAWV